LAKGGATSRLLQTPANNFPIGFGNRNGQIGKLIGNWLMQGLSSPSSNPAASNRTPLLEAQSISKSFEGNLVLSDIDLAVLPGEIHAVVGENGAGKSTLMKVLGGVYQPDQGHLFLGGQKFRPKGPKEAIDHGIVVIHQELSLTPHLSTEENIFLGHYPITPLGTVDRKKMRRDTLTLLQRLSIELEPSRAISQLSVAQQQMVEIAKALSRNPKVLILDEPTAVLDDENAKVLFQVLGRLREQKLGMIYISHRLEEVFAVADRVTVLRDGKCTGTSPVNEITQEWLINRMIGRNLLVHEPRPLTLGKTVLRVQNLGRKNRFHNVSLSVARGEILGLAGLVGAGRTEIAKTIFGLERADEGSIEVFGKTVKFRHPIDAIKAGLVYVTEDRKTQGLFLNRPVLENITIGNIQRFFKFPMLRRDMEWNFTRDMVSALDIRTTNLRVPVRTLSGGNQQKVLFARSLGLQPKLLILDEPTRGVDIGAKQEIYATIERLTKEGLAILLISSDMEELLRLSDKIIVLREGFVTAQLTRQDATENAILEAAAVAPKERHGYV
jgi:ABC-type sugar transport system ATPase subunit